MGIGPSAHSYNGANRSWNIANNILYLKAIQEGTLPSDTEKLTVADRYNEYVMTGLRTIWGVSEEQVEEEYGKAYRDYLSKASGKFIAGGLLANDSGIIKTTKKGRFLTDGIASDLFYVS